MFTKLYHYTNQMALEKILQDRQIRFSALKNFKTKANADYEEFIFGLNVLRKYLKTILFKKVGNENVPFNDNDLNNYLESSSLYESSATAFNLGSWFILSTSKSLANAHLQTLYSPGNYDIIYLENIESLIINETLIVDKVEYVDNKMRLPSKFEAIAEQIAESFLKLDIAKLDKNYGQYQSIYLDMLPKVIHICFFIKKLCYSKEEEVRLALLVSASEIIQKDNLFFYYLDLPRTHFKKTTFINPS